MYICMCIYVYIRTHIYIHIHIVQKRKLFVKDFFGKCDFFWISSHLLKNSLTENFIFCCSVMYIKL